MYVQRIVEGGNRSSPLKMKTSIHGSLQPSMCTSRRSSSVSTNATRFCHQIISISKPYFKELQHQFASTVGDASDASRRLLGAFVGTVFLISHQPLRSTEGNFAPVDEIGKITEILDIAGEIPTDFPEGVYIRNGSNPLFGALHSSNSIFGKSHDIWVEGEGMPCLVLHQEQRQHMVNLIQQPLRAVRYI